MDNCSASGPIVHETRVAKPSFLAVCALMTNIPQVNIAAAFVDEWRSIAAT
jgi:hypothetical protein